MGNRAEHPQQQLQLFRPSSINLNEPADRWQFVARINVEGCSYYLTPAGRWSTDLQAADTFSSPYVTRIAARAALVPPEGSSWHPSHIDCPWVRRGLVVIE